MLTLMEGAVRVHKVPNGAPLEIILRELASHDVDMKSEREHFPSVLDFGFASCLNIHIGWWHDARAGRPIDIKKNLKKNIWMSEDGIVSM